jgi:hypothetical protein
MMKHPLRYFAAIVALAGLYILFVTIPQAKEYEVQMKQKHKAYYESVYVDPNEWAEGRVCDKLQWDCLPESKDTKRWQRPLENGLDSFELTPEVLHKRQEIVQRWRDEEDGKVKEQSMQLSQLSEAFYDRVEAKKFLSEMEESLEKEFPGFWRGVPIKVRYRWIQRAMNKAKRFGVESKTPGAMVELCARIGLDFDKDPKWQVITEFVLKDPNNNIMEAINYLDWTVFEKTHALTGTKITDWLMRRAIGGLPKPKKPYPKLND